MKFPSFKEPRQQMVSVEEVVKYLTGEMVTNLRELRTGLDRLAFDENFESFTVDVSIAGSAELAIRNQLRDSVPSHWIVVDIDEGSPGHTITRGVEPWTNAFLYLKNASATAFSGKVRFFK